MNDFTKKLYALEPGKEEKVGDFLWATRVPGGWVFYQTNPDTGTANSMFVPFDNEFMQ